MAAGDLDVPGSDAFSIVPWCSTNDGSNHLDISDWYAWRFRRIFGYLVSIEETDGENTDTAYRLEIMVKFPYRAVGQADTDKPCHLFATIRTYSSCACITGPESIILGDPIVGFVGANYNGRGLAQLEGWKQADLLDWKYSSPDTMFGSDFGDFEEWTLEWTLRLTVNRPTTLFPSPR